MCRFLQNMEPLLLLGLLCGLVACNAKKNAQENLFGQRYGCDAFQENCNDTLSVSFKNDVPLAATHPDEILLPSCITNSASPIPQATSDQLLQAIHQDGLSLEMAVRVALTHNAELFAYYENLNIGYAALWEAGLRQNPTVTSHVRFPHDKKLFINKEFETSINFLDTFLIPLREQAAEADLRVIEAEVEQKVLELVREVSLNWLELKTLEQELAYESSRVELKDIAAGLAQLQQKAGNITSLSARTKALDYEMAQAKFKNSIAARDMSKEKLNRSLGLMGNQTCYFLSGTLDWQSDSTLPDVSTLETAALENRWDILARQREIDALAQEANLKQWWTYSAIRIGVSKERETDGTIIEGPVIEREMPIFNHGQAEAQKYQALIKQAQTQLLAKAIDACSEVREFFSGMQTYRVQLEELEKQILPDFALQIAEAQTHYNVMALGIYDLFDIKEAQINAQLDRMHALRNYTAAKIELFHAIGASYAFFRTQP